jgi:hypothetical protein
MRRRWVTALGGTLVLLAGCGPGATPIPAGCTDGSRQVTAALRSAPRPVALVGGFRLSQCISDGTDEAELLSVGLVFHQTAEALRVTARDGDDHAAAVQLGYLVGATRRGAKHTNGVMAELQRRIELVGGRLQAEAPALADDVTRGLAAGERTG